MLTWIYTYLFMHDYHENNDSRTQCCKYCGILWRECDEYAFEESICLPSLSWYFEWVEVNIWVSEHTIENGPYYALFQYDLVLLSCHRPKSANKSFFLRLWWESVKFATSHNNHNSNYSHRRWPNLKLMQILSITWTLISTQKLKFSLDGGIFVANFAHRCPQSMFDGLWASLFAQYYGICVMQLSLRFFVDALMI